MYLEITSEIFQSLMVLSIISILLLKLCFSDDNNPQDR